MCVDLAAIWSSNYVLSKYSLELEGCLQRPSKDLVDTLHYYCVVSCELSRLIEVHLTCMKRMIFKTFEHACKTAEPFRGAVDQRPALWPTWM